MFLWVVVPLILVSFAWVLERSSTARSSPIGNVFRTPGFTHDQLPNLESKVAIVTGATSGVGRATAMELAIAGATVVVACRDVQKGQKVVSDIKRRRPDAEVDVMRLVLSDLSQVEDFVDQFKQKYDRLHILVNNAGQIASPSETLTADGIEATFQVNYLSHFLLTIRLLDHLKKSAPARIVHVSSSAHRSAPPEGVYLDLERHATNNLSLPQRYGMSKLAQMVFSKELSRRLTAHAVYSNACHPGLVDSNFLDGLTQALGPTLGPPCRFLMQLRNKVIAYSPETAALTPLSLAAGDGVERDGVSGRYFVPIAQPWPIQHPKAASVELGEALWAFSERLVDAKTSSNPK